MMKINKIIKKKDYNPDFLPTKSLSKDLYYLLLSF